MFLTQKTVTKLSENLVPKDPGFKIRDLKETYPRSQIRIQESKKHRFPQSGFATILKGRIQYRTDVSKYAVACMPAVAGVPLVPDVLTVAGVHTITVIHGAVGVTAVAVIPALAGVPTVAGRRSCYC